jgi:serine/threonine protein kinase
MGDVFLARDTQLQRTVALKIPKLADAQQALRARFLLEARAAARLGRPNIRPVYDADGIDGRPYLTMAFVEGPSLAARLRQAGPFVATDAAAKEPRSSTCHS